MPTPTSGFVYITGIGVVGYPGGVATLYDGCDYNDGNVIVRKGIVTAFDPSDFGISDHDDLGNLGWTAGGHTGTASRFAWFGSTGAAEYVSVGTGLSVSANVLSCTVTAGTFDHAALTSNLLWTSSGHTGNANHVPWFSATGVASTSNNFTFDGGELYAGAASFGVVELPAEAADKAVYLDSSKTLRAATATLNELNHLTGATSNIQAQINGLLAGMNWKASVRCASTTGLTLSGIYNGATFIDDILVATGDRILLKNQSSASENGIYVVGTSGPPTRATDSDTSAEMLQATVFVREGTTLADTQWTCTNNTVILGTTGLTWAQVSGAGTYSAGSGITLTGNIFSIASTYVGQTSITTLGTIATGTWNATAIGLAKGGTGSDLSATGPGYLVQAANAAAVTVAADLLVVKNTSGSTATANEAGYIDASGEYKTTTTANLEANWCAVVSGAANNSDIVVARRGRVTIKLNANCAAGDFLSLSSTAGSAAVNTTFRAECFAVALTANVGGAGGTCSALLLTHTRFVSTSNSNFAYNVGSHANTNFVATINGSPSTTSVVYNAPSAGSDTVIVPANGSSNWAKMRLYNTTRGTYRLIESVNTGTKTITTVASTDSWASGDTIKIESQTTTTGLTAKAIEVDLTQATALTAIPKTARAAVWEVTVYDTSTTGNAVFLHPFEAYASSKLTGGRNAALSVSMLAHVTIKLINRCFCIYSEAGGATSKTTALALTGYFEACP